MEVMGLAVLTYLIAYLDPRGRNGGRLVTSAGLEPFLPRKAGSADRSLGEAAPPRPG